MIKTMDLYDLTHTLAADYLARFEYPWQALKGIKDEICTIGKTLGEDYIEIARKFGYTKQQPSLRLLTSAPPASSALRPKCGIVPLSAAVHWLVRSALLATPWNLKM